MSREGISEMQKLKEYPLVNRMKRKVIDGSSEGTKMEACCKVHIDRKGKGIAWRKASQGNGGNIHTFTHLSFIIPFPMF